MAARRRSLCGNPNEHENGASRMLVVFAVLLFGVTAASAQVLPGQDRRPSGAHEEERCCGEDRLMQFRSARSTRPLSLRSTRYAVPERAIWRSVH
jgi:hypothetical protein